MKWLILPLQTIRFFFFSMAILSYIVVGFIVDKALKPSLKKQKLVLSMVQFFCRLGLYLLGVKVSVPLDLSSSKKNYLIVANHMSYLDVLIIASQKASCFVTSVEIKETPFLGFLTRIGGCLYVERRSRINLTKEIEEVTVGLQNGFNVCVFPEATSTNAESVLRFKRPLFRAAIEAPVDVLPVTINYRKIDGEIFSTLNRDSICWYGDMDFLPHLWQLLSFKSIEVDLVIEEPLKTHGLDESALSELAHSIVSKNHRAPAIATILTANLKTLIVNE